MDFQKKIQLLILALLIIYTGGNYVFVNNMQETLIDAEKDSLQDLVRFKAEKYDQILAEFGHTANEIAYHAHQTIDERNVAWIEDYDEYLKRRKDHIYLGPGKGHTDYLSRESTLSEQSPIIVELEAQTFARPGIELAFVGLSKEPLVYFDKPIAPIIYEIGDFDHRTRPWYLNAVEKKDLIWTNAYIDAHTNKLTITAATPIISDDGELLGVAGVDLLLETMQEDILDINYRGTGEPHLISQTGEHILHEYYDEIGLPRLIPHQEAKECLKSCLDLEQPSQIEQMTVEGKKYLITCAKIESTGHALGFIVPESVVLTPVKAWYRNMIYLGAMIAAIIAFFGFIIAKTITRPIDSLMSGTQQLRKGNYDYKIKFNPEDEFASLIKAFNNMIKEIGKSRKNLERERKSLEVKVKQRTKQLEKKNRDLERFNRMAIGREIKMADMKKQIEKLKKNR